MAIKEMPTGGRRGNEGKIRKGAREAAERDKKAVR